VSPRTARRKRQAWLAANGVDLPPVASNVVFTGDLKVGATLTGDYDYSSPQGTPESGSLYQWYAADDGIGTNEAPITGATSITYDVEEDYVDKYLSFGVIPSDGTLFGTEAFSDLDGPVIDVDPEWANVGLLVGFNVASGATLPVDESANAFVLERPNGPTISSTVTKFGIGAGYQDGTFRYWLRNNDDVQNRFGTGLFTIEGWFNLEASDAFNYFFGWNGSNAGLYRDAGAGTIVAYQGATLASGSFNFTTGTWRHVAVTRDATTLRIFVGGALIASAANSTNFSNGIVRIGTRDGTNSWHGWVDEFRTTKGVARYTAAFTPPTRAFPRTGP
jgi:hypothetical protein